MGPSRRGVLLLGLLPLFHPVEASGQEAPEVEAVERGRQTPGDLDRLGWMTGCWEAVRGERIVEERWLDPRGGLMLGMGRTLRRGRAVDWEFLRIFQREGEVVLGAYPSDQAPSEFRAVAVDDTLALFENPEHDFPQRIIYRPGPDSLWARIEGAVDGRTRGVDFRLGRVACER